MSLFVSQTRRRSSRIRPLSPIAKYALTTLALTLSATAICPAQTATVGSGWVQQSPAISPSARYGSATTYDAVTGMVVLFGGRSMTNTNFADTWTYNGATWTQQSPAASPSARYGAAIAYDAAIGKVVLFGGNSGTFSSETWTYDGTTWILQSPSNFPPARADASMVYDAATGTVVLFGGQVSGTSLADTWTYDGTNWTQQSPATSPLGRSSAGMAYDASTGTVVLFGGSNNSQGFPLQDTWTYNETTWNQQVPATSPPARDPGAMSFDVSTGSVVLFGGSGSNGNLGDTWTYDGTTWTQQSPANNPSARTGPASAYDAATGGLVLFGGLSSTSPADTWAYFAGSFIAPTTNVGTPAAQTSVYFTIVTAGTLGTLTNANVLTQGAAGLDFTLGTGSTCTGAVTAGQSCVVNVVFTPKYPGQRRGAVNLTNSSGTVIATAFISGTGSGPQATLSPGLLTTTAGVGTSCPYSFNACGDGGPATAANLSSPQGVISDGAGNLYISDSHDSRVRELAAATGFISTVAGTGGECYPSPMCGDGGAATAAKLSSPAGLAVDGAGNLYIADEVNNNIRKVTAATGIISTVTGSLTNCPSPTATCGDGGPASNATLYSPTAIALDGAGNLFIEDEGDSRIRKVTAATGLMSTVVGTGVACGTHGPCGDGGQATSAQINAPGFAIDGAGNLYIADQGTNSIRKVTAATGVISTVAGNGTYCSSPTAVCGDGGQASAAELHLPNSVVVDVAGDIYISDVYDYRIRRVSIATGIISTVAASGTQCNTKAYACGDGGSATASAAGFYAPDAMALDAAGNLYITDPGGNRVRKVSVKNEIEFPTATTATYADTTDGTQTSLLNNIGNLPLTISAQTETGAGFVLGNPNIGGCSNPVAVAAGGNCLLGATFAPVAAQSGVVVGGLAITDNSLNVTTTQNVPLLGTTTSGAANVEVVSNSVAVGAASVTLQFLESFAGTVADTGAITATVNGSASGVGAITCTGKPGHQNCTFAYTGPALATGGIYPIAVSIAADTNYSATTGQGTLTVMSPKLAVTPTSLMLGSATVGFTTPAQSVTLQNTGTATVTGITLSLTGTNPTEFAYTNGCTTTLAVGASCTVSVTATPASLGGRSASLNVASNSPDSPRTVTLTATGVAAMGGPASLSATGLSFTIGGTLQDVTLSNLGNTPLHMASITESDTGNTGTPNFAVSANNCGSVLPAQSVCTLSIVSAPVNPINYNNPQAMVVTGTLVIADDAAGSPQTLSLRSFNTTYFSPNVQDPAPTGIISFPGNQVGYTQTATALTYGPIEHSGAPTMTLYLGGANPADFAATEVYDSQSFPYCPLSEFDPCYVTFTFTPTAVGARTARVYLNSANSAQYIMLTGTALPTGASFRRNSSPALRRPQR